MNECLCWSEMCTHQSSFLNQDLGFAGQPDKIYNLVKDIGISINGKWGFPDGLIPSSGKTTIIRVWEKEEPSP